MSLQDSPSPSQTGQHTLPAGPGGRRTETGSSPLPAHAASGRSRPSGTPGSRSSSVPSNQLPAARAAAPNVPSAAAATRPGDQPRQRPGGSPPPGPGPRATSPPGRRPRPPAQGGPPSSLPRSVPPARLPAAARCLHTHPAVGRRPVPAAAARRAAGDGRPVPDGPAASVHSRGGLRSAATAALGAGPAAAPASAAAASLAPVQLNDVVQRHVHFVGHGGRRIGLGSSPRVSTPARHFRGRAVSSGAESLGRPRIGCEWVVGAGRRVRAR